MEVEVLSEEGSVESSKGLKLFSKCWKLRDTQPRALIFVNHGVGEHCSRYEEFAQVLAKQGFLVVSHDHVGHGRSEGERVQISSFSIYVADVLKHIDEVLLNNAGLPIFLFGHSMGGTIAILCAMERPHFFTGTVLCAPAILANPETATPCMIFLGKIVSYIAPSYQVVGSENHSALSRDPDQVATLSMDPLGWKGGLKAKWAMSMYDAMEKVKHNLPRIEWPFLVCHGDADQLAMVEGSTMLEQKAASKDKTIKIYPGFYHKLLNEPKEDAALVINDILSWLSQRVP